MPSPSANPTPITPPRVALIDQRTGLIERSWYMFFLSLFRTSQDATDPQVTPDTSSLIASYDAALTALAQEAQTTVAQEDIRAELDALRQEAKTRPVSVMDSGRPPPTVLGLGDPTAGKFLVGNGYWLDDISTNFTFNSTGIGQYLGINGISTTNAAIGMNNLTAAVILNGKAFTPTVTEDVNIGAVTLRYKDAWFSSKVYIDDCAVGTFLGISGVSTTNTKVGINNSTAALILDGTSFVPSIDNSVDIGSATYRYKDFYLKGSMYWNGYAIPAPAGATTTYLRNDGTWGAPATNYSYTGTATGMTTSPTGTIYYTRVGDLVTMNFPNITGTSNVTTFTITGGPTTMRPSSERRCVVTLSDNSVGYFGTANIQSTGTIEFYLGSTNTIFTNAGGKGVLECSISYTVT